MEHLKVFVHASWDDEARVWYVAESNVPGLAIEAKSQRAFERLLVQTVPELIELNGVIVQEMEDDGMAPAELVFQKHREVSLAC